MLNSIDLVTELPLLLTVVAALMGLDTTGEVLMFVGGVLILLIGASFSNS